VYDLKTWNNLKKNSVYSGQMLTIYVNKKIEVKKTDSQGQAGNTALADNSVKSNSSDLSPAQAEVEVEKKLAEKSVKHKYYSVKRGDTLFKIAGMYKLSLEELLKLNKMSRKSPLQVGQRLKVG
jgi:LysM repeat protein